MVKYRRGWGANASYHRARVKRLAVMVTRDQDEAVAVVAGLVDLRVVNRDALLIDLDDGHRCFGFQLVE